MENFKKALLASQHLLAMIGATLLVPILTGIDIQVALFCAGLGTLIFHFCTKGKVPVFLGSSFAFIPGIIAVKDHHMDISYAHGGLVLAGAIYVLISFFIKSKNIRSLFPPFVIGPVIMSIGLSLFPVAFNMGKENLFIFFITMTFTLFLVLFSRGFLRQMCILIGILFGCLIYYISYGSFLDVSSPSISMLNFTYPKFSFFSAITIVPIVLAVSMEHIGDIAASSRVCKKDFIKDPGLSKTFLGDGLATMICAMIGGPANTTYGENTGVLAITKNYDPSVLRLAAIFAITLSFFPVFSEIALSIPLSVMGGVSMILFSMIAKAGFDLLSLEVKGKEELIVSFIILLIGLFSERFTGINQISLSAIIGAVIAFCYRKYLK